MRYLPLFACAALCWAQSNKRPAPVEVEKGTARCHVYAVDTEGGKRLMEAMQAGKLTLEEAKAKVPELEKRLPAFNAPIAEEQPVTRHFDLPGTPLKISATVMFTDESMPVAVNSLWLGLAVGNEKVADALTATGAVIAEDTYKLLVKTKRLIDNRQWVIGAECQLVSDATWIDRQKAK
jgi:hypothetical protein